MDGQRLFREGLTLGLSRFQDIEITGGCSTSYDISSLIMAFSPKIVLLSIDDTFQMGIGIGRMITTRFPDTSVITLTSNPTDEKLSQAIKAGAAAHLGKDVSSEELVATIRLVNQGKRPIINTVMASTVVMEQILSQFQEPGPKREEANTVMPLTAREMAILKYVADGNSNKQIAYTCDISEQTVKNHLSNIMIKLQANDRTHAVVLAIRYGWFSAEVIEEKLAVS